MLEIERLQAGYGDQLVLDGLELSVPAGAVHGLVGLNGAGKSTLFAAVYGFLKPRGGAVRWQGRPIRRGDVGFLETENYFYSAITGREHLDLFPDGHDGGFRVDVWQDLLRLPLDTWVDHYSTGMRKKLALLAVLKTNRSVLLLDEPFNGVDLETSLLLRDLLLRLAEQGKTVLVSSHVLETLMPVCSALHYLAGGRIRRTVGPEAYAELGAELQAAVSERNRAGLDAAFAGEQAQAPRP
jgi:ABC-2 type transport system ATP-binding protein